MPTLPPCFAGSRKEVKMLVPLEIAILFAATSVWLVWDALRREESAPRRAAMTLSAIGAMMVAIAGRFPLAPGVTGFSPFVTAGALVIVAGMVMSIIVGVVAFLGRRRLRNGPVGPRP
jgi:hypothetical protein